MEVSRICIKNLPVDLQEEKLKEHFSALGSITDVKIMRTKDGKSRQFGFIGFSNVDSAKKAISEFSGTYLGMYKLVVELAKKIDSDQLQKPQQVNGKRDFKNTESLNNASESYGPGNKRNKLNSIIKKSGWDFLKDDSDNNIEKDEKIDNVKEEIKSNGNEEKGFNRLFVRNLSFNTTESDLNELFTKFGDVSEINIIIDKAKNKSKGYAFVQFTENKSAEAAIKALDGDIYQGRILHIIKAEKSVTKEEQSTRDKETKYFKDVKEDKLKDNAGNRSAWNSLYIKPDTVNEAIAQCYGISKNQVLDPEDSGLGVRVALGESYILSQTKQFLADSGINISLLEEAAQGCGKNTERKSIARSMNTLIVKNLPHDSSKSELEKIFELYGKIKRFILPPSKSILFVEYTELKDAAKAFKNLAYKKYKNVPLFLEWAPKDLFLKNIKEEVEQEGILNDKDLLEIGNDSDSEKSNSMSVIYVKNLSFATEEATLRKHFDNAASEIGGSLRRATIIHRLHAKGHLVSAGYGFVEFDQASTAKHVLKKMQDSLLDGHYLKLSISTKRQNSMLRKNKQEEGQEDEKENVISSKLLIKNMAFESTKKDIVELFGTYGHIKNCRLPKKIDGNNRGFAFVEYSTKQEAQKAMEALLGVHFYGRRLNIDYAKE